MATRWRIKNDELILSKHATGMRQRLIDTLGEGYSDITPIDDELDLIETHYTTRRDFSVLNRIDQGQLRLVLTIGLQGCSRYVDNNGTTIEFNQGYTSVTSFNAISGERQYQNGRNIHQLRFAIGKQWLTRHYDKERVAKLLNKGSVRSIGYRPTTYRGELLSRELCSLNSLKPTDKLYTQGLIMMLIANELAPVLSVDDPYSVRPTPRDRNIAYAAHDILEQEYQNPPSVEQLARRVGTNSCKLKALFHQCFNNTPYGVLLDIRMKTAYQLLSSSRCHVNTAAFAVGYEHASNFSAAFKKFFGISPKAVAKQ